MADRRVGAYTVAFHRQPRILAGGSIVGPKEGHGPLGTYFDQIVSDAMRQKPTPEAAERQFLQDACQIALTKAGLTFADIQYFISGDLMNQIVSSTFVARDIGTPYFGIFSACATIAEGLGLAAMQIDGGFADHILVGAASHYQSVERQYRYPIELNIQRKQTNQMTVTGAGAAVVGLGQEGVKITHATFGRVVDYGLKDPNDMGSAMAPAAMDTFLRHLEDTGRDVGDYDLIMTGDLATYGKKMFNVLAKEAGLTLGNKHQDCGALVFAPEQQAGAGGSGAGCPAMVILGYLLKEMENTKYRRVLIVPTGALHSPLTWQQGDTIPCIAHAIALEI